MVPIGDFSEEDVCHPQPVLSLLNPGFFLWGRLGGMASPGLLGLHESLKGLASICPLILNEKHLGLKIHCTKEERCFPLPNPILVFQGDTGPQGFPGTPGEVGPKGEKVMCVQTRAWPLSCPSS